MLTLFSINTVNISKLFSIFARKIFNTVVRGLSPRHLAYGQDKLNAMFLEPIITKLACSECEVL